MRHFALFLWLSLLCLIRVSLEAQTLQTNLAVIVQHAPNLSGGAVIQGSLQQLDGETVTLNTGVEITGDLLVPGTPTVVTNGSPINYAGTVLGDGSSSPSGYQVILDANCTLHYLRTRTTPVTLPTVSRPPSPTGTRSVNVSQPGQSYGDPDTLLNLTLSGSAGLVAVPPGTYGDFTVQGPGLVIGVAGAVQPVTYNLQNLTLSGSSTLKVVGPVILTVANGFTASGAVGSSNNPAWLQLNIASGNFTISGGSIVYGLVAVPNGLVTIDGSGTLVGTSASTNFVLSGSGLVRWGGAAQTLLPPVATNQTIVLAENSATNITLTGSDPQNLALTYFVLTQPAHGVLSGTPPNLTYQPATNFYGSDSFTFDVNNGVTNSSPATISLAVTQVYYRPTANSQTLTNLENTALPVTLTGSDPQNYSLTYSVLTQPSHGTLSGTATNLVYQPAANYYGPDAFTFQVNDGVSNSAPATISITVEAVDEAPMVSAGSNQLIILPNNAVSLNGTVTYAEFPDTVDTIIWSQLSGPGSVSFSDASNTTTTASFSTNGVYVLQLYASDSYLSATGDVTVTVDAPPTVNAGPETTNTFPGSITLQGAASDDGLPYGQLNLNWSEVSGPGTVIFSNPSATNASATFSTNGIYVLRLTADDGVATNGSDVTVIENMPPMVNAGANILTNGLAAMLNGSVSDDGLPSGYLAVQWVQSSGPGTATFSNPTSTNTAVSVDQSGVFVFTLIATDGAATNSSEVDVTFNLPPVVTAGSEQTVNSGTVVTLAGVATDDHLPYNILDTVWSEVSGPGTATFAESTVTNTTVTFDQPGVYDLRLTVDDGFATNSADVTIQTHGAPIVSAGSNQVSAVGSPVTLTGSFVDDGLGGPVTAQWTQISGPAAATIADPAATNTVVTFNQDGIYVFALTVTDGLTNGSAQVTITSVAPPGVTVANPSIIINWPANQVTLNGTATADGLPSGGTLTETWSQISGPAAATLSSPVQSETLNGSPVSLPSSTLATFSTSGAYAFQLAATNQVGSAQSNIDVIVNQPPVVNAGLQQTVNFGTVVTLAGVATDDHLPYNILNTVWSEVSGPGTATFAQPTLTNTTVTFNQPGVYDLRLTANDGFATNSADVTVQVHAAPTVFAGTNQVVAFGAPATLAGSFVDDGMAGPATVQWTQVSGPVAATISNPTSTNTVVNMSQDGLYVFALTVTDSLTNGSAQVTIASVKPPLVGVAPASFFINWPSNQVTLNGTATADGLPPGGTLTATWSQLSGPATATLSNPVQSETLNGSPVSLSSSSVATFNTNGVYVFQLAVTNQVGGAQSNVVVTINQPPVVNAGVTQTNLFPATAQLSGTVTDDGLPAGGQLTWSWSIVSGPGTVTFNNATLTNATATFSRSGIYVLQLTASDSAAVSSNQVVIIEDTAPTVRLATNQVPAGTNQVLLTGTVTDDGLPPGAELTATWGLVSGSAAVAFNPAVQTSPLSGVPVTNVVQSTATFSMAGSYVIKLTGNDSFARNSATISLSVTGTPPVVYAGPDLYLSGVPATATLNGQVTDAVLPLGATLTQNWSVVGGPGTVTFGSPTSPVTTATFSTNGIYVLQLRASNGQSQASSMVEVRVETLCTVQDPQGLTAWWPANGNSMDVVSEKPAIVNGVGYTNGEVALAFNFNKTGDVRVPATNNDDVGSSPAGFSVEFWTKGTPGYTCAVLGWSNGVGMVEGGGNNALYANIVDTNGNNHSLNPAVNVFDGNWHHVAVTYDRVAGVADVYKDGVLAISQSVGSFQPQTTNDLYMGQVSGYSGFEGQLDEISLYRRPLDPEEVYNIYASGSVGKCPDTNVLAVYAGQNFAIPSPTNTALLSGSVTENGQPAGTNVQVQWTKYYGPGTVTFSDPTSAISSVTFSTSGFYILQLSANNSDEESSGLVEVRVGVPCNEQDLPGLSAWWPADGTAEDIISGNEAILGGGTSYTNGEVVLAFNFNGVDQFVEVPAATNYNVGSSAAGFTMEFWTKGTPGVTCAVLGWQNGVGMVEGGGNNALYADIVDTNGNNHSLNPAVNVFDGNWHHVAVTYDRVAGVADVYKDGVLAISQSVGSFQPQTTNDLYMGQVSGYSDFKGQLDEISLYNRPLSADDIMEIYVAGSAGKCPNNLNLFVNQRPSITPFENVLINWPMNQALLSGVVSDDGLPIGGNLSANWTEVSGPGTVTFAPQPASIPLYGDAVTNPISTVATFSAPGLYELQLTANDTQLTNTVPIVVTVNQPPVVNGGGNQIIPFGTTASLQGTVQDDGLPVGAVVTNEWLQISGPGTATFANSDATATSVTFNRPGTYQLELLASDTAAFSSNVVTITMVQANSNQPPVVYVGPNQIVGGTNIAHLQGVVTGGTAPVTNWWSVQSGPGMVMFANSNSPATVAAFSNAGTYVLTLSAMDPQYTVSNSVMITIDPADQLITVNPGPSQTIRTNVTDLPGEVTADGLATNAPLAILWSQVSGPAKAFFAEPSFPNTMVSFSQPGSYVLQLSASPGSYTVSSNVTITVLPYDEPPIVNAGVDQEIWNTNQTVLQGTVTDPTLPPGGSLQTTWSVVSASNTVTFSNVNATNSAVTFGDNGSYQLRLTATDGILTNSDDVTIIVAAHDAIPYEATNTLYRFTNDVPNFNQLDCDETLFTNGQAGFGNYGDWPVGNTNFTHTYWPGDGYMLIRKHFYVPPGTANLSMGFSVDNNGQIFINGNLITPTNIDQMINNNGCYTYFDSTPGDEFYTYWIHECYANLDDAVLVNINTNTWHVGENLLAVRVWDDGIGPEFWDCRIFLNAPADFLFNSAPVPVIANTNPVVVFPSMLDMQAQIEDDGLPTNAPYKHATWSEVSGPGTVTFSQPVSSFLTNNDASTYASFSAPGTYHLQLLADDSQLQGVAFATVYVLSSSNELITVSAGPNQTIPLDTSAVLDGTVTSSGSASGTVTTSWSELSGPGIVSFTTVNGINYAAFSAVGTYVLQFTGSNGQFSNSSTMTVTVTPPINRSLNITTSYPTQTDLSIGANLTAEIIDQEQPAGSVLTDEWVTVSGPAQAVFSQKVNNFPDASAHADFPVAGNYVLGIVAGDGQLLGTAQMPITVTDLYQGHRPPTVSAGQPMAVPVNVPITLNGTAIDNDATNGTFITQWSEISGPTLATFANATQTNTTTTFGAPGNYVLQLTASDGQFSSSATVDVVATNTSSASLVVYAGGSASVTLPDELEIDGVVIDENSALALYYQWTNISGPGTVTFLVTNITTNATAWLPVEDSEAPVIADFSAPGNYQLQVNGTDGTVTNSDILDVTVLPATNVVLSVSAGQPQTIVLPNEAALNPIITAVGLSQSSISLSWSQVSGPGTATFSQFNGGTYASFSGPGVYELQLTATSGQYSASGDVTITVYGAISPPSVSIDEPVDATVVTAPTNFIGTASSPILQSYQLQYRFKNADGVAPNPWVTFASGTTSVTNGVLGTLDPTMMLNGIYEIQLMAVDSMGQTVATPIQTVSLEKNLKVGNFTLSFQDLNVPVSGIPIQIVRTYDSRDQRQDDFGIGWSLDIKNITLQKTRSLGPNWYQTYYFDPVLPYYELDPVQPREITVTMAGNKVYHFDMQVKPMQQYFAPIESVQVTFTNEPGTYGGLGIDGDNEADLDNSLGYVNLINLNDFSNFNPTRFYFTNEVGDVYVIDETNGLESETDPNQNTLLIETNGIVWTNSLTGNSSVAIHFVRDGQGRIGQIIDPAGNPLNYNYDTNGNLIAFTDRNTNTTTFAYTNVNFPHYLTTITNPNGVQAVRSIYDDSGRIIQEIGPNGYVVNYTHDFSNNREEVTDALGYTTVSYYDNDGNVVATIDPLGNVTTYQYDSLDNQIEKVDALGNTNSYTYDLQGNQKSHTDPLGYTTYYTYDPHREKTSVTTPRGYTTTNSYDGSGDLLQTTDPLGNITSYSYDLAGNMITRMDALGNVVSNSYDGSGHILSAVVIDAQRGVLTTSTFTYDSNGNQLSKSIVRTAPQGIENDTTHYIYDGENRVIETIDSDGSSNMTVYALGLNEPAVEIDQLGRQTLHFYDANGDETNTVFADGTSMSYAFDADNRKISMTDQEVRTTFYTNDPLGRLAATVYPGGAVSNTVYDAIGRIIATVDELGNTNRFEYDPNCGCSGRQTDVIDPLGHDTHYSYDGDGNETSMIDALGHIANYSYDPLERHVETIFPDGTTKLIVYDALGRRIAETDQNTNTTEYAYDALSRLVAVTNALGKVTAYSYDEADNVISETDANQHTTTYVYDSMGRRIQQGLPSGQTETYAYDMRGNLTNQTDFNGHSTTYTYDSLNRLSSKIPDPAFGAPTTTFTYTSTGQRATMADASGKTVYSYNSRDWLTNKMETFTIVNFTSQLNYSYDPHGNLTEMSSSDANGININYRYDPLNRLQTVQDVQSGITTYAYDAVGNLTNYVYPNGIISGYAYDTLNRLTNLATLNRQNALIAGYNYTVAAGGQRLTSAESVLTTNGFQTINRIYNYDATYRLLGENYSISASLPLPTSASITYTLDAVGNRLSRASTLPGIGSVTSSFDANDRLTSEAYDNNGNTLSGNAPAPGNGVAVGTATLNCGYDFEDRVVTATNANGSIITVAYDGDGNRVSKTVNSVTTLYLVDEQNPSGYAQVLEELSATTGSTPALVRNYVYGNDLISEDQVLNDGQGGLAWSQSFYGYDGHGNVRYLTDVNGNITDTYDYDAFGNQIAETGTTPNVYLYCEQQYDDTLGLYYNRARYLDTDSARFWTLDKNEGEQDDPESLHRYLYVQGNPINSTDPSGFSPITDLLEAIGIDQTVDKSLTLFLRRTAIDFVENFACQELKDEVVQGIYAIVLDGNLYIGQSKNIARRIKQWENEGEAIFVGALKVVTGMSTSRAQKFIRELIEQAAIDKAGTLGTGRQRNNPVSLQNLAARVKKYDPVNKLATKAFDLIPICKNVKE